MSKDLDLVVYGATGFTGQVVAARAKAQAPAGMRVAFAGRNRDKLERVAQQVGSDVEIVIADAQDEAALGALAARARVVLSAAGPFALYGSKLFAACVDKQTAYADINGEPAWVRSMIDAHHARALEDGTPLVPFCGYDSVPSEIGTWLITRELADKHDQATAWVHGSFRSRGGVAGGSIATMINGYTSDAQTRRMSRDPYSLVPSASPSDDERRSLRDPQKLFRAPTGEVQAPHVMAMINTRVVRRSAALYAEAGAPYGSDFRYTEGSPRGRSMRARMRTNVFLLGLAAVDFTLKRPSLRWIPERALPKPGEGPSVEELDSGRTRATFVGEGERGARVTVRLDFAGDPGNRFTASALVESGLLLAEGRSRSGGVLTPAYAFGEALVERLRAVGVKIEVD
jgi:short subunit dehydrogenase-like uncharacterized protein